MSLARRFEFARRRLLPRYYGHEEGGGEEPPPDPEWTPHTDPDILFLYDPAIDVTLGATMVYGDQTDVSVAQAGPGGLDLSMATAAKQPGNSQVAELNNQWAITMDGGDVMQAASSVSYKFLHDGTANTVVLAFYATATTLSQAFLCTNSGSAGNVGFRLAYRGTNEAVQAFVSSGVNVILQETPVGSAPLNAKHYVIWRFQEGRAGNEYSLIVDGTEHNVGNTLVAPSSSNPFQVLHFGGNNSTPTSPLTGGVGIMYALNRWEDDLTDIQAHLVSLYGSF